ncbi:MAG: stalk domain-containing protein [Oscillospiraceae bacterium]
MKKLTALIMALALTFALAEAALADGYPEDEELYCTQWDYSCYLDEVKAEMGLVYDVNVMTRDGAFIFEDAPAVVEGRIMADLESLAENLGGTVTYSEKGAAAALYVGAYTLVFHEGSTTLSVFKEGENADIAWEALMDTAPYISAGKLYVPVRFSAEALGYDVYWDDLYRTAVLLKSDEIAAEIDRNFTVINKLSCMEADTLAGDSFRQNAGARFKLTVFDTINGDETYPVSFDATAISGGESVKLTINMDLSSLKRLLLKYAGELFYDEDEQALAVSLIEALSSAAAELIIDMDGGIIFIKCPALMELLGREGAELDGKTWLSDEFDTSIFDELEELLGGPAEDKMTLGGSICEMAGYSPVEFCRSLPDYIADYEYCMDDKFTAAAGGYSYELDLAELAEDVEGGVKLNIRTSENKIVSVSGSMRAYMEGYYYGQSAYLAECEFSISASQLTVKGTYHIKNTMKLEFDISMSSRSAVPDVIELPQPELVADIYGIDYAGVS